MDLSAQPNAPLPPLPQIHLDLHTSEQLTNIVGDFGAGAWAQQQAIAYVNTITCFA